MELDIRTKALLAAFLILVVALGIFILLQTPETTPPTQEENQTQNQTFPTDTTPPGPPTCDQIISCTPGDGCCPEGCAALMDYDCPGLKLGEIATAGGLQLELIFLEERRCVGFSGNNDYKYYFVFHAEFKNTLNKSQFIRYPAFYLLDEDENRYIPDIVLPHYRCRDNYQDLLLETKYIGPNKTTSGEVWIEVDKEKDPLTGILRIVYDPTPPVAGDEFVYSSTKTK